MKPGVNEMTASPLPVDPARKAEIAAFGAHPDDVELTCGGTVIKMSDMGYRSAVVDMTRGELGSKGDRETRDREAAAAAKALGLSARLNLDLPDSGLFVTPEAIRKVVETIRDLRPVVVIAPYREEFHPDHVACSDLVQRACFHAGMTKYPAAGAPHRPKRILFAMFRSAFKPSFIVDVSAQYGRRMDAMRIYRSQLFDAGAKEDAAKTDVGRSGFLEMITNRARYYGQLIGTEYGEPFFCTEAVAIEDPVRAFAGFEGTMGSGFAYC